MNPGPFSTRPLSENEARIRYNFDCPPKVLSVVVLMRAVSLLLIPLYVVYLMMFYGWSFLPSITSGLLCAPILKPIGFHCVLPVLDYVFASNVAKCKLMTRSLLSVIMLFIHYRDVPLYYGAISVIVSLVCVIGGYWARDPSGFSDSAAEGFMVVLLIEIFYKEQLNWPNTVCTSLACLVCLVAVYTEVDKTSIRIRDALLGRE
ncbi:hypothetical protein MKW94_004850 [Papaver nudicaule]|uniref:Uncharacterized protein n=1 Tax=Papaver nudicaule TaxID=74823 RepID=A0AA41VTL7_PAPNU|nr:hypothetical protein [Papaver nudicaule]